jgi:hypothetical protein
LRESKRNTTAIKFMEMERTPEKCKELWSEIIRVPRWTMGDGDTIEALAQRLSTPDSLYYDVIAGAECVGYMSFHRDSEWSYIVHALFFDGQTRGREEQVGKLCDYVMKQQQLSVVRTFLPTEHATSLIFAKRTGFIADGIMRKVVKRHGVLEDLTVFSYQYGGWRNVRSRERRSSINGAHATEPAVTGDEARQSVRRGWRKQEKEGNNSHGITTHNTSDSNPDDTGAPGSAVSAWWHAYDFLGVSDAGTTRDAVDHTDRVRAKGAWPQFRSPRRGRWAGRPEPAPTVDNGTVAKTDSWLLIPRQQ